MLCRFNPVVGQCTGRFQDADGMVAGPLTALHVAANNEVFYGTDGHGFSRFRGGAWHSLADEEPLLASNQLRAVVQDSAGDIWVATSAGVQHLGPVDEIAAQPELFSPARGDLPVSDVQVMHADPAQGIWIGASAGRLL